MLSVRPRFSLLTILLLMTIAGLSLVVWRQWQDVGPLREEVRRLRAEVGALAIDDKSKVHAIEVLTSEPLTWRWRVWLPTAAGAQVHIQFGGVPRDGFPETRHTVTLHGGGEQTINMTVRRDPISDKWICRCNTAGTGIGFPIAAQDQWFLQKNFGMQNTGVGRLTAVADDDEKTFLLKRHRVAVAGELKDAKKANDLLNSDAPAPGFIIWLERQ